MFYSKCIKLLKEFQVEEDSLVIKMNTFQDGEDLTVRTNVGVV